MNKRERTSRRLAELGRELGGGPPSDRLAARCEGAPAPADATRATGAKPNDYPFSTDTEVAFITAKTLSPSFRFIRSTEPVVIMDVTLPGPESFRGFEYLCSCSLGLNEREQVGIDDVGLRRDHAVRVVLVRLERAVFEELG